MRFLNAPAPLVVIVGPTAVGKTELSLQLAERLNGEIVSADSRLFYRGMDIGTAKPTVEERERVPHHLIDVADPDESWSLPVFKIAAQAAIEEIQKRGELPFLVGGTGQYIHSITEGWLPPPQPPDPRLRAALEQWGHEIGSPGLYTRLALIDPQAAAHILPGNLRRIVRALEVIFSTGKRFSEQQHKTGSPYNLLQIGSIRPRQELYRRVDDRLQAMLDAGFVDEVRNLLAQGYLAKLPTLSAIGYREIAAYLQGEMSLDEAVLQMKRLTRQFIRRQANWFKLNDPNITWFEAGKVTVAEVVSYIQNAEISIEQKSDLETEEVENGNA